MQPEWIDDADSVPELVSLFMRSVGPSYICQGDLLAGRSDSIYSWRNELPTLLASFFTESIELGRAHQDGRRGGILAIRNDDAIQGFAVVEIHRFPNKRPHAFLHDIVVDPLARSFGMGTSLMRRLKEELLGEGIHRLFLESGTENYRAHTFFERHGFQKISISMMVDLDIDARA